MECGPEQSFMISTVILLELPRRQNLPMSIQSIHTDVSPLSVL